MLNDDVAAPPRDHSLESRTRDRVLRVLSEDGPLTASALAERLDLTDTAIRRHLENLLTDGLIEPHDAAAARRTRGRPARSWVVSASGHQALASDYDHLAGQALRFLAETAGQQAVTAFAERRVAELEQRYAAQLAQAGGDRAAKVEVLVEALNKQGFAASARPVGAVGPPTGPAGATRGGLTGIQVCQGHCPVGHVAAEFPQFCDAETEAFSRMLGVHVQRLATLAHGDHVCTTFVPTTTTTFAPTTTTNPGGTSVRPAARTTASGTTAPGHHRTPTQERSAR